MKKLLLAAAAPLLVTSYGDGLAKSTKALGHTKIESTVRYLGVEVDDALAIAEQVDI